MSAFLGKIHFWLYHKIILHEGLINSIAALAEEKGYSCEQLLAVSFEKYGDPVTGVLEEHIDHANIHGWLQDRIFSVEKRLAFTITELLKKEILSEEEITQIFYDNGVAAAKALEKKEGNPQDLYTMIFDNMLEGMPCDHVSEMIENTDEVFSWRTTRCLHKEHWDEAGGDIDHFYSFRDSWIRGFLSKSGNDWSYTRSADGINIIRRG